MKINYHQNPLYTTVEPNEFEKRKMLNKIKIDHLEESLYYAHLSLEEGERFDLIKAREEVRPDYYRSAEKSPLDKSCERMLGFYLESLQSHHVGDCTCVPCSCMKCQAEDLLDINTIKGLGSHSTYKVDAAFGPNNENTIDEAIENLAHYKPIKGVGWEKYTQEQFDAHFEKYKSRWSHEAKLAHDWLVEYKNMHFK